MSGASFTDDEKFSFTPFTRHPFFTQVNRWIIDKVICPGRQVIVDLGCGPGAVTKLILERTSGSEPPPRVIGVDPSPSAIAKARAAISSRVAEFMEGSAELLSRLVPPADAVVFLNAIHLIQDKHQVPGEIRKTLKPRGLLGFNSTFFAGAYVEGTSGFWRTSTGMYRSADAPPGDERGRGTEAWVARAGEVTLRRRWWRTSQWALESRPGSPPPLGTTLAVPACAEECELADVELCLSGPASVVALFRAAVALTTPPPP